MKCFKPILDKNTEILILGSFPSIRSLEQQQYYGHPQNHFWKILGNILDEELYSLPYNQRITILKKHRIGIWDVYQTCEREGSLDSNIKKPVLNDFTKIKGNIHTIIFNGQAAGRHKDIVPLNVIKHIAPSTSPANTMKIQEKVRIWKSYFQK